MTAIRFFVSGVLFFEVQCLVILFRVILCHVQLHDFANTTYEMLKTC